MEENAELLNLSCLIIERAFPKDTDMTPERLLLVLKEKIEKLYS